jgi:hypothetical protein
VPLTPNLLELSLSLHLCLQAGGNAFDVGGWEAYGDHWRYFFDCMLAPMAPQAQSALDKLPATATPRASLDTPNQFFNALLTSWGAMVGEITRGSKATAKASWQPQVAKLFAYALAPQHGPVIRTSLSRLVQEYRKWTGEQVGCGGWGQECNKRGSWLCASEFCFLVAMQLQGYRVAGVTQQGRGGGGGGCCLLLRQEAMTAAACEL